MALFRRRRNSLILLIFIAFLAAVQILLLPPKDSPRNAQSKFKIPPPVPGFSSLNEELHILSGYLDFRSGNMGTRSLRILAIAREKQSNIHCAFLSGGLDELPEYRATPVSFYEMAENHARTWKAYVLSCSVPSFIKLEKFSVRTRVLLGEQLPTTSKTPEKLSERSILVPIVQSVQDPLLTVPEMNYSICVPVFFGSHYGAKHLVEFLELNFLLGADHVFIYANLENVSEEIRKTLYFYEELGLLTVHPWNLPVPSGQIWYHGQLIAIQDCLYRNMGLSSHVFFHDLDEVFIPKSSLTFSQAFKSSWEDSNLTAGFKLTSYYFRIKSECSLMTLDSVERSGQPETRFTKCVVRPERIFEQGIHHVSRVVQDYYSVPPLSTKIGALHHYKGYIGPNSQEDRRIPEHFGRNLKSRFRARMKQLNF